jgi:hypothetical protein
MIGNEFKRGPMPALSEHVLRRKPVEEMAAETGADTGHGGLKRTIGLWSSHLARGQHVGLAGESNQP